MRPSFRVYYLAGALLSAPLLGIGSLQLWGRRWAGPLGLALQRRRGRRRGGDAGARRGSRRPPCRAPRITSTRFPRVVAIAGSSLGALAVSSSPRATLRRRPLGNALIVASVAAAAAASALTQTAVSAAAALLRAAARCCSTPSCVTSSSGFSSGVPGDHAVGELLVDDPRSRRGARHACAPCRGRRRSPPAPLPRRSIRPTRSR